MSEGLFDQFTSWYEDRYDYVRELKGRTGRQVVAILIAASMLRVPGAHNVTGRRKRLICIRCAKRLPAMKSAWIANGCLTSSESTPWVNRGD